MKTHLRGKASTESDDLEIEESDNSEPVEVEFWAEKQRELVTSQVDFNLSTIKDLVDTHAVNLAPGHQRRFRWTNVQKSRLIESF